MDIRKLLGTNLIRLRGSRTQAEVAESCNLEIGSLSRWENGKAWASSETIETLANYYKVDSSELYRGEEAQKPLQMPVSETIQKMLAIPDEVYDKAQGLKLDDPAWEYVKVVLDDARDKAKLVDLFKKP